MTTQAGYEHKNGQISAQQKQTLLNFLALADDPKKAFAYEELLGFIFGLAITPDTIPPREWLPAIFEGEMPEFPPKETAQIMLSAITDLLHANMTLARGEKLQFPFNPFTADDQEIQAMMLWILGLNQALLLRPAIWAPESSSVLSAGDFDKIHFSMGVLESIVNPDSAKQFGEKISDQMLLDVFPNYGKDQSKREQAVSAFLIASVPMAVTFLTNYARACAGPQGQERNELCRCGSGKKFKKCCGMPHKDTPISPVQ